MAKYEKPRSRAHAIPIPKAFEDEFPAMGWEKGEEGWNKLTIELSARLQKQGTDAEKARLNAEARIKALRAKKPLLRRKLGLYCELVNVTAQEDKARFEEPPAPKRKGKTSTENASEVPTHVQVAIPSRRTTDSDSDTIPFMAWLRRPSNHSLLGEDDQTFEGLFLDGTQAAGLMVLNTAADAEGYTECRVEVEDHSWGHVAELVAHGNPKGKPFGKRSGGQAACGSSDCVTVSPAMCDFTHSATKSKGFLSC